MAFSSFDIRLYSPGRKEISKDRKEFHCAVAELCGTPHSLQDRKGELFTTSLDTLTVYDNPGKIRESIDKLPSEYEFLSFVLFDLSSNRHDLVREAILLNIAQAIDSLASKSFCTEFAILLPLLLESEGSKDAAAHLPSRKQLLPHSMNANEYKVFFLGGNGKAALYSRPDREIDVNTIGDNYRRLSDGLKQDAIGYLEDRVVRCLGHFAGRKVRRHRKRCRRFSFRIDNADGVIVDGLKKLWLEIGDEVDAVLYDADENEWFREPVLAFAVQEKLESYPIRDVLRNRKLAGQLAGKKAIVVLDVVVSGETLRNYLARLGRLGIVTSKHALAAISEPKIQEFTFENKKYIVMSLIKRKQKVCPRSTCPQCKIGLPHSAEPDDGGERIRAFDFWSMVRHIDWEPEQYVPEIGYPYDILPRFGAMINEYGDWITYKIERRLQHRPIELFLVHPEQPDIDNLSNKLRLRLEKEPVIVRIPSEAIYKAQKKRNQWRQVLPDLGDQPWIEQLNSLTKANAIIMDIFNGSGSTYGSLRSLLDEFGISIFCYFPLVDRHPGIEKGLRFPIVKDCLYEWYGPRRIKEMLET